MQSLELADSLFPAVLDGSKTKTLRWNEPVPECGPLLFYSFDNPDMNAVVTVTSVENVMFDCAEAEYGMTPSELYQSMLKHYPDIPLDAEMQIVRFYR